MERQALEEAVREGTQRRNTTHIPIWNRQLAPDPAVVCLRQGAGGPAALLGGRPTPAPRTREEPGG